MNIPVVNLPDSTSALLDLLGDKNDLGVALRQLQERVDFVNKMSRRYNEFQAIEHYESIAQERMREANEAKAAADVYRAEKVHEANKILDEVNSVADKRRADLDTWNADLTRREQGINKLNAELLALKDKLDHETWVAQDTMRKAIAIQTEGEQLKKKFEEKLAKINELA